MYVPHYHLHHPHMFTSDLQYASNSGEYDILSCSPSDANHKWYKPMQILMIPMSEKKNYKALIKPQFLFLNDKDHP